MWPEEEELLFPPFTYLTCNPVKRQGCKQLLTVEATISTSRVKLDRLDLNDLSSVPQFPMYRSGPTAVMGVLELNSSQGGERLRRVQDMLDAKSPNDLIERQNDLCEGTIDLHLRRKAAEHTAHNSQQVIGQMEARKREAMVAAETALNSVSTQMKAAEKEQAQILSKKQELNQQLGRDTQAALVSPVIRQLH